MDTASIGSSFDGNQIELIGSRFSKSPPPDKHKVLGKLRHKNSSSALSTTSSEETTPTKYAVRSMELNNISSDTRLRPDLVTVDAPLSVMKYFKHTGSPGLVDKLPNIKYSKDWIYDPAIEQAYVKALNSSIDSSLKKIFPYEIDDPHKDKQDNHFKYQTSKSVESLRQYRLGLNPEDKKELLEKKIIYENFPRAREELKHDKNSSRPNTTHTDRMNTPYSGRHLDSDSINSATDMHTSGVIPSPSTNGFDLAKSVYAKRKKIPTFLRSDPKNIEKMKESIHQISKANLTKHVYAHHREIVIKEGTSSQKNLPGVLNPNYSNNHHNNNNIHQQIRSSTSPSPTRLNRMNSFNTISTSETTEGELGGNNTPLYTAASFRRPKHLAGSRDNSPLTLIGVDPPKNSNHRKAINPTNQMSEDLPLPLATYVFPPTNSTKSKTPFNDDTSLPSTATLTMLAKIPKTPQNPGGKNRKKFGEFADLLIRPQRSQSQLLQSQLSVDVDASNHVASSQLLAASSGTPSSGLMNNKPPVGMLFCQQCLLKPAVLWCTQCMSPFCGICWNRVSHHTLYNMIPIDAMNTQSAVSTRVSTSGGDSVHSHHSASMNEQQPRLPTTSGGEMIMQTSITNEIQYPMYKIKSKFEEEVAYATRLKDNPYYHSQIVLPEGHNAAPKFLSMVADHVRYPRPTSRSVSRGQDNDDRDVSGDEGRLSFSPPKHRSESQPSSQSIISIPSPVSPNKSYTNTILFGSYRSDDDIMNGKGGNDPLHPLPHHSSSHTGGNNLDEDHYMYQPAPIPRDDSLVLEYQDYPNPPVFIDGKGDIHDVLVLQDGSNHGNVFQQQQQHGHIYHPMSPVHHPHMSNYHSTNSLEHPTIMSSTILPGTVAGHLIDYTNIRYKDPLFQSQITNAVPYGSYNANNNNAPSSSTAADMDDEHSVHSLGSKSSLSRVPGMRKPHSSMESKIVIRGDPYAGKKPTTAFSIEQSGVSISFSAKPGTNYEPMRGISHEIIPIDWKQGYFPTEKLQKTATATTAGSGEHHHKKGGSTKKASGVHKNTKGSETKPISEEDKPSVLPTMIPKVSKSDQNSIVSNASTHSSTLDMMSKASHHSPHPHHLQYQQPSVTYSDLYTRHMPIPKMMKEREIHIFHGTPVYTHKFSRDNHHPPASLTVPASSINEEKH